MSNVLTAELGLSESRARYVGLYQETADFYNALIAEGGSVAERLENASLVGGLTLKSTCERSVKSRASSSNQIHERRELYVALPDIGGFNRQYLTEPHLVVTEFREDDVITLLHANVTGHGGTKIGSSTDLTTISWNDDKYVDGKVVMVPDLSSARWVTTELIKSTDDIEYYFRPAEALVNALRGIAGEYIER